MGTGTPARAGEANRVVADSNFDASRHGEEIKSANDDAGVGFVDCHMWLGDVEKSKVHFHRVENGGLVWAEDLGILVPHAWVVDVKETRG